MKQPYCALVRSLTLLAALIVSGCTSGRRWVNQPFHRSSADREVQIYDPRPARKPGAQPGRVATITENNAHATESVHDAEPAESDGPRPELKLTGSRNKAVKRAHVPPPDGRLLGEFRNTYYDFPAESAFISPTPNDQSTRNESAFVSVMNASCQPIKTVPRAFYDSLCVQGSGTLLNGSTVSFAKRDCSCAELCPRTSQKICFDVLDQSEFPWGRGALGKAITPLGSVAVDSDVIPLGTHIYIAEFDGVLRHPAGGVHNGCFVAEDRGLKVKGKHVDVFTGNPTTTVHLNGIVPSNQGVHVYLDTTRCK